MADNIEHQDKGELVANCDRFNSLKHSTDRSNAEVFQRPSTMEYHQLEMQQHHLNNIEKDNLKR